MIELEQKCDGMLCMSPKSENLWWYMMFIRILIFLCRIQNDHQGKEYKEYQKERS